MKTDELLLIATIGAGALYFVGRSKGKNVISEGAYGALNNTPTGYEFTSTGSTPVDKTLIRQTERTERAEIKQENKTERKTSKSKNSQVTSEDKKKLVSQSAPSIKTTITAPIKATSVAASIVTGGNSPVTTTATKKLVSSKVVSGAASTIKSFIKNPLKTIKTLRG